MDRVPITHEFGRVLAANFHHFEILRDIMRPTLSEWKGCGSYLIDGGESMEYDPSMYGKQCSLYDCAKAAGHAFEIGVHGGHSLLIMLLADAKLKITCVDICAWSHTEKCVKYLNSAFGDRITFWKGDTLTTLPAIVDNGGAERWDLIHIDGSHDIDVIREEFELVRRRATPGATVVVFDDYSAPGLADQITIAWRDELDVLRVPDSAHTHCVARLTRFSRANENKQT